jgi:hypothetical protein
MFATEMLRWLPTFQAKSGLPPGWGCAPSFVVEVGGTGRAPISKARTARAAGRLSDLTSPKDVRLLLRFGTNCGTEAYNDHRKPTRRRVVGAS